MKQSVRARQILPHRRSGHDWHYSDERWRRECLGSKKKEQSASSAHDGNLETAMVSLRAIRKGADSAAGDVLIRQKKQQRENEESYWRSHKGKYQTGSPLLRGGGFYSYFDIRSGLWFCETRLTSTITPSCTSFAFNEELYFSCR